MNDADPRSQKYIQEHAPLCAATAGTRVQVFLYACALPAFAVPFGLWPYHTAVILSYALAVFFLLFIALRLVSMLLGLFGDPSRRVSARRLAQLNDNDLPVYSILVPLYHEPEVVPELIAAMRALDYPTDKLDIQILIEPGDKPTLDALAKVHLPEYFRLTQSPDAPPRTKPRACNEGLARARGELLVIYDAEDRPEPDQLKKAVVAYRRAPESVVCLQARLGHYNSRQSLFARWSAMEYLSWYQFILPGLQRMRAPIPLGGTSNHFRVDALRALGGWDPFNVTEDCDLGMRIARRGWKVWMLDSTTWEEAVTRPGAWIRQRSRWIKGYWQTWMVHTRHRPIRELGIWGALHFALTTGGSIFTFVINPIMWCVALAWFLIGWPLVQIGNPLSQVMLLATLFLMGGNLVFLALNMMGCLACRRPDLVFAALLSPIEWVLLSVSGWLALAQSIARPFHWEKTHHGRASEDKEPAAVHGFIGKFVLPVIAFVALGASCLGAAQLIQVRIEERIAIEKKMAEDEAARIRARQLVYENLRYGRVQRPHLFEDSCYEGATTLWGFEGDTGGWYLSRDRKGYLLDTDQMTTESEKSGLRVPLTMPGETDVAVHPNADATPYGGLTVSCYLPPDAPKGMQILFYMRDRDDLWYEHLTTQTLLVGRPTRFEIDMDARRHNWEPRGHAKPYDIYTPQQVRTFGIRFLGKDAYDGPAYVDRICTIPRTPERTALRALPAILDLALSTQTVPVLSRIEASFRIGKAYANPFDPEVVDVRGRFTPTSGGEAIEIPAFYWQDYARDMHDERERLTPTGAAEWKVRFAPPKPGEWTLQIALKDSDGCTTESAPLAFVASPSETKGYLRIAEKKKRYFSYADGSFYYPIGHNVCFPVDQLRAYDYDFPLPWGQRTYYYDDVLTRMADAGENWVRLWMTPWGFGVEGPGMWSDFHGAGRYNLANAWRLDHVLDLAEQRGIRVCLTMGHYSEYNQSWRFNQYNKANGGFLNHPKQVFTNPEAIRAFQNRLRYIIARWGYSENVMAWELWGEVNLVPGYTPRTGAAWHKRMISYIHQTDPFGHMIFTHCHNWQRGHSLWALPGIQIVQGNGYIRPPNRTENHVINFRRYLREVRRYPKPILVAEYGGRSERGAPSRDYLTAQMHSGLWASFVYPFGGTAMHWWWNFIHGEDLYGHYAALTRFAQGIDRLQRDYAVARPTLERDGVEMKPMREPKRGSRVGKRLLDRLFGPATPRVESLEVAGMQAADAGFYWVYHPMVFVTRQNIPTVSGVTMTVDKLEPGTYVVEFWDTDKGEIFERRDVNATGPLRIDLPPVQRDLGVRILPR